MYQFFIKLDISRRKSSIYVYIITLKITAYKCKIVINAVFILRFYAFVS